MRSREFDDLGGRIETLRGMGFSRRDIIRLAAGVMGSSALAAVAAACRTGSDGSTAASRSSVAPTSSESSPSPSTSVKASPTVGRTSTPRTISANSGRATPSATASSDTGSGSAPEPSNEVEIEYWQYTYEPKVRLVNELIPTFQERHPKITIKHVTFPYDVFQQNVQAAVIAGSGPDVLNLYYGWVPAYYVANYLRPLPESAFPASMLQQEFFPMLSTVAFGGRYYALPIAVRTLGLFWNRGMLREAGFDQAPATWDELVDVAIKTTKRGGDGALEQAGLTWDPEGQGHNWWRSCLTRQNGGRPISDDNTTLRWTDAPCEEAWEWYLDLHRTHRTGERGFYGDGATAFQTKHAALHIDSSYRVSTLASDAPDLDYAIAPLPTKTARASYASFWCNAVTRLAGGDKGLAAAKWIEFLSSAEVMRQWTPAIGELPARIELAKDPAFAQNERIAPFLEQLAYSYADFFVDETVLRQAVLNAIDRVLLGSTDAKRSLDMARQIVQQGLDDFWALAASKG